jgi:hypothetical protein
MAVDSALFKIRFPALVTVPDATVDAHLDAARLRTPARVWEDLQDEGVLYLAAHLIVIDPNGIKARLADKSGRSVYLTERERLERTISSGFRVSGDTSGIII